MHYFDDETVASAMHYLKNNYPYLFSLAMRLNPFDEKATPEVK